MKKTIAFSLLIAMAGVAASLLFLRPSCGAGGCDTLSREERQQADFKRGKGPMHPGYIEQWMAMKAGPDGKLPLDLIRQLKSELAARRASNKTGGVSTLSSIAQLGPENVGGRTRTIVVDKNNANRLIAGGVSGGLWLSTNKGISWSPVDDRLLTLSVMSLAQDPSDANKWYFCTGEGRGNSAGVPGSGLFKSTDNGVTWNQLPGTAVGAFDYTWKIAIDPTTAGEVYVGTKDNGLWRSTDAGATWNQVFGSTGTQVTDVEIFPSGGVIIGVNGGGVFKSPSGDPGSFVESTTGLPVNSFRRVELAYCQGTPSVVYAAIEDSVTSTYYTGLMDVYKSTDAGITWVDVANPDDDYGFFFSFAWYSLLLAVRPDNPNWLVCGVGDLAYSSDGGTTWNLASYSHADYHTAVFDPSDNSRIYVGNDGGFYEYSTGTIDFTNNDRNNGYMVTQYYAGHFYPSGLSVLGGTQDNGTHQMYSGSSASTHVFGGDGSYCAVNQQNPLVSYVSYQYGQINRADDSDNPYPSYFDILFGSGLDMDSDGSVDDGCWFINPFEIHQGDGEQLYFVTNTRIFRTTDGGSSWDPITNAFADKPYTVGIAHQEVNPTLFIGGMKGLFYRITNGASTTPGSEVDLSASVPASVTDDFLGCITVHPMTTSVVYACFTSYSSNPRIWRVEDANTSSPTWVNISGNLPVGLPVNWVEVHPEAPEDYLIAATDNGLFVTTDGGTTWNEETSIPNVSIHQIRLRKTDRTLFIPTHGRGFWTATLPPMVSVTDAASPSSMMVWPNPVTTSLHVEGQPLHSRFEVMDVKGRQLLSGTLEGSESIDVSSLSQGIYLIKVGDEVRKFVKR